MMTRMGMMVLLVATGLSGCASNNTKIATPGEASFPVARVDDPAPLSGLAEAANRSSRSLRLLASAKSAEAQKRMTPDVAARITLSETTTPDGWGKPSYVEYTGSANHLIKRLTETAGYRFFEAGKRPIVMPVVDIVAEGRSLIEVLRDAMAQLPTSLQVNIYPTTRSVVMTYQGKTT